MLKSVGVQTGITLANIDASIITIPVLMQLFGIEVYGEYVLYQTYWLFILVISDLGGELVGLGVLKKTKDVLNFIHARLLVFVFSYMFSIII
jgi:O-antigen/teichoic acid export membrane protein